MAVNILKICIMENIAFKIKSEPLSMAYIYKVILHSVCLGQSQLMLVVLASCLLNTHFHSQKCPSLEGILYGHLICKDLHDLDPAFPCIKIYALEYASLKIFSITGPKWRSHVSLVICHFVFALPLFLPHFSFHRVLAALGLLESFSMGEQE